MHIYEFFLWLLMFSFDVSLKIQLLVFSNAPGAMYEFTDDACCMHVDVCIYMRDDWFMIYEG